MKTNMYLNTKYDIYEAEKVAVWKVFGYLERDQFRKIYNKLKEKYNCKGFEELVVTSDEDVEASIYLFVKNNPVRKIRLSKTIEMNGYDIIFRRTTAYISSKVFFGKLRQVLENEADIELIVYAIVWEKLQKTEEDYDYIKELAKKANLKVKIDF